MRRLLTLIACFGLILSLGIGSMAHAMESSACMAIDAEGVAHSAGDTDEVPADAGKAYPHHHGNCHGHHVAATVENCQSVAPLTRQANAVSIGSTLAAAAPPGAALRPPIA